MATLTDNETETETDEASESESGASGPGFGSALVSLGGAGYLLQRPSSDDDTESG